MPTERLQSKLIAGMLTTPDAIEGVTSFFQRRTPDFPGRITTDLPPDLPWQPT